METEGHGTNRETSHDADNVVPFPREWIGPTEDLVPIGPSSSATAVEDDEELGRALGADAFWGERAACLHEPIEAPPAISDANTRVTEGQPERLRTRDAGTVEAPGSASGAVGAWERVRRGRSPMLALGLVVAALLVVGVALAAQSGPHSSPARLASAVQSQATRSPGIDAAVVSRLARLSVMRAVDVSAKRTAIRRRREARSDASKTVHGHARSPVSMNVTYSSSEGSYTSASSTVGSAALSSGGGSAEGTASPSVSTGGSSSSSTSGGSGPVGPGAPFGPGQMGSTSG